MGVVSLPSTLPGGLSIVCNSCGAKESWDVSEYEYNQNPGLYDGWRCKDCKKEYERHSRELRTLKGIRVWSPCADASSGFKRSTD